MFLSAVPMLTSPRKSLVAPYMNFSNSFNVRRGAYLIVAAFHAEMLYPLSVFEIRRCQVKDGLGLRWDVPPLKYKPDALVLPGCRADIN